MSDCLLVSWKSRDRIHSVLKTCCYVLVAFVALDEPSNLPRLAIGQLFHPDMPPAVAVTDITELEVRSAHIAGDFQLEHVEFVSLDGRLAPTLLRATSPTFPPVCPPKLKGATDLLRC